MKKSVQLSPGRLLAALLMAVLLFSACEKRQSTVPQTAPAVSTAAPSEAVNPTGYPGGIREAIPYTEPGVEEAAVLRAEPMQLPEDLAGAAAGLLGVSAGELTFEENAGTGLFRGVSSDGEKVVSVGALNGVSLTAERYHVWGQISPRFLALYESLAAPKNTPYGLPHTLTGVDGSGELPGFSREEAMACVRDALRPFGVSLQEAPSVMLALDDETLARLYEHLFGGATGKEVQVLTGRDPAPYHEGQACYYLLWETQAEGIPLLCHVYSTDSSTLTPAVTLPAGVTQPGGMVVATVGADGIVTLGTGGVFWQVTEKEEARPVITAADAASVLLEQVSRDESGVWKPLSMRLAYVPFSESGADCRLVPCWVCMAQFGNFFKVYAVNALTGEEAGAASVPAPVENAAGVPEEAVAAILAQTEAWAAAWPYGETFEVFGVRRTEARRDTIPYGYTEEELLTVEGSIREAGSAEENIGRLYKWYFAEAEDGSFAMVVPDPEDAAAVMALAQESAAQQGGYFSDFYVRLPDDYDSFYPHTLVHREDHVLYVVARLRHSAWGPDDWTRWTWSMREKEDGTWEIVDEGY